MRRGAGRSLHGDIIRKIAVHDPGDRSD